MDDGSDVEDQLYEDSEQEEQEVDDLNEESDKEEQKYVDLEQSDATPEASEEDEWRTEDSKTIFLKLTLISYWITKYHVTKK